jgi:hypothetical protein
MKYKFLHGIGNPDDPQGMIVLLNKHIEWMQVRNYSPNTITHRIFYIGFFIR